ncbi:MAG: hypothetical protein V3V32_04590 [Dehalococcoidia bacterium]
MAETYYSLRQIEVLAKEAYDLLIKRPDDDEGIDVEVRGRLHQIRTVAGVLRTRKSEAKKDHVR